MWWVLTDSTGCAANVCAYLLRDPGFDRWKSRSRQSSARADWQRSRWRISLLEADAIRRVSSCPLETSRVLEADLGEEIHTQTDDPSQLWQSNSRTDTSSQQQHAHLQRLDPEDKLYQALREEFSGQVCFNGRQGVLPARWRLADPLPWTPHSLPTRSQKTTGRSWSEWSRRNHGPICLLGYRGQARDNIVQWAEASSSAPRQEAAEAIENATETVWNLPAHFRVRMHSNSHRNPERGAEPEHRPHDHLREEDQSPITSHFLTTYQLFEAFDWQIRRESASG